jgi:hypothetical protein
MANKVIEVFKKNAQQSRKIRDVLIDILEADGAGKNLSAIEAEGFAPSVLSVLRNMRPQDLPFDFGSSDPSLLVGKGRIRPGDTDESIRARKTFKLVDDVWNAILDENDFVFESFCAACLKFSGVEEAYASCSVDDGGIDLFGRISIGKPEPRIDARLLETNILSGKRILFLGQAKKYAKNHKIGRPDLQQFSKAVSDCLGRYEGNPKPPSHRVPQNYYRKNELCIPIFMTTSEFSDKAEAAAFSYDMLIVTGREMSEFICSRSIGFVKEGDDYRFDKNLFHEWLVKESDSVKYKHKIP